MIFRYIFIVLLLMCQTGVVLASAGDLDPAFGANGVVTVTSPYAAYASLYVEDTVMQPDGKVIAVGTVRNMGNEDAVLLRYNPDGSLDTTFLGNGKLVESMDQLWMNHRAVALTGSGSIVVASERSGYYKNDEVVVSCYKNNGELDGLFGSSGRHVLALPAGYEAGQVNSVMAQGDGKVLLQLELRAEGTSERQVAVVRLDQFGVIDKAFAESGWLLTGVSSHYLVDPDLLQQPDHKIVIGLTDKERRFVLLRYLADGAVDTGFGDQGRVITVVGHTAFSVYNRAELAGVQQQPDGRLLVYGNACNGDSEDFYCEQDGVVLRFDEQGALDVDGFGVDGMVWLGAAVNYDSVQAVFVEPGGHLAVAGIYYDEKDRPNSFLARLDETGALDSAVGRQGMAALAMPAESDDYYFSRFGAGDIAVVYNVTKWNPHLDYVEQQRIKPNGQRDGSFGRNGIAKTMQSMQWVDTAGQSFVDPGQGFYVYSTMMRGDAGRRVLMRFTADGSVDKSFKKRGVWSLPPFQDLMGRQQDGQWITSQVLYRQILLKRYQSNGKLDRRFGKKGTALLSVEGGTDFRPEKMQQQPDGKWLLSISHRPTPDQKDIWIYRLMPDGTPDAGFGTGGKVLLASGWPFISSLHVAGDGKIYAGLFSYSPIAEASLVSLLPNGQVNDGFGSAGSLSVTALVSDARGVNVQDDGDGELVFLAGTGAGEVVGLGKLQANGNLDTRFGTGGLMVADVPAGYQFSPSGFHRLLSGQWLIQGDYRDAVNGFTSMASLRISADGVLDTGFGTAGFHLYSPALGASAASLNTGWMNVPSPMADGGWLFPYTLEDGRLYIGRFLGTD
jgi:uncharacterized delta-60 repeat protein